VAASSPSHPTCSGRTTTPGASPLEIDLFCTLVAGSEDLAEALVGDPRFEAWRVDPADPIAFDSDRINT
jgi:hypothetical protein